MGCVMVAFDENPWVKIFDISNIEITFVRKFEQKSYI